MTALFIVFMSKLLYMTSLSLGGFFKYFWNTQLDVRGCNDVAASFAEYVKADLLEGDNKYDAGDVHGKQDAEKGVRFLSFPPVLHLHLKRFVFDPRTMDMDKVDDRYQFPLGTTSTYFFCLFIVWLNTSLI